MIRNVTGIKNENEQQNHSELFQSDLIFFYF